MSKQVSELLQVITKKNTKMRNMRKSYRDLQNAYEKLLRLSQRPVSGEETPSQIRAVH